ncbi:N-acetylmuramoyl-L-alanine amidase [Myxococcus sp. CA051A]|uniref:N-acetylmuramoyl-L-alanine amidase n=1 Tax=Myxococcus sp. CA051A TaxID=2741739 RepID=UPI00157A47FB|nr:N-acetylmuramoyl-L-alanine amidase [Myxococcus sp. CA051A]NTX65737.1 N-acetylmuramoyl-L-alanine amidase [Myxococcus sp. CA051A]
MPVPEVLRLYGRTDVLTAVGDQQPPTSTPAWNAATRHRNVTRTITLHYTHGWVAGNWQAPATDWYGATFNIDLDGTLFQCEEMIVRTNHVGGAPDFSGQYSFVNLTSIGVELARFGKIQQGPALYSVNGYPGIDFQTVTTFPDECNYSTHPGSKTGGTRRYKLGKINGGTVLQSTSASRSYYYIKVATFDDERNDNRATYPMDVLFTEEQYQTLVKWAKCMCEMNRIPKAFLLHPATGVEQPWIDVQDLIELNTPAVLQNKERVRSFQGIIGHNNIQADRSDPGASMDFYRLKRGVSDEWWYPVNLDDTTRALNYLETARSADYIAMTAYNVASRRVDYFTECEGTGGGYFPVGLNRLWHGGIHLPSGENARPVYAMANGRIVAARVVNGLVQGVEPRYSRCFVLVRHEVHVREDANREGEIDYGADSTETVYSLYMHLRPEVIARSDAGAAVVDYAAHPDWLNHYFIDHPTDQAPDNGDIFYPDQTVLLSDLVGHSGTYITGMDATGPVYGPTVHVEVFTTADVSRFADSPWVDAANRMEDTTEDLVCDLPALDDWLQGRGYPPITQVDVRTAVSDLRQVAVRFRSEWSLQTREQLTQTIVVGQPAVEVALTQALTNEQWEANIRPLCFHTDMQGVATEAVIGPFLGDSHVWHLHPLVFMQWMNERVARHEQILRSQDKTRGQVTSTIAVENGYVVRFVNPVPSVAPPQGYAEVRWNDNLYEVTVDRLCDLTALAAAPQQTTRFRMRLLDALEMINDRQHGVTVLLSHVAVEVNALSARAGRHLAGNAVDVRPGNGTTVAAWYEFIQTVRRVVTYLNNREGVGSVEMEMLQDADGATRPQVDATANSREWLTRLLAATAATDAQLTAVTPGFATLQAELGQMRLHLHAP